MEQPRVSIIIPCFNGEGVVHDAIESALAQTYLEKEVIVVDDGSTDRSLEIINGFGTKVKSVTGPNQGGAAARNRGLSLASGEFVQFLDADDLLKPDKLAHQVPFLVANRSVDVVYSDWEQYETDVRFGPRICAVSHPSEDAVVLALQRQNIQTNAPIYRRETLERLGTFREDLPCCQERDLNLRLACNGAVFRRIDAVLHVVRPIPSSVSSNELRVIKWMRLLLWQQYNALKDRQRLTAERRAAFAALMAWQGRRLMLHGKRNEAKECFDEAAEMDLTGGLREAYGRVGYGLVRWLGFRSAEKILIGSRKLKRRLKIVLVGLHASSRPTSHASLPSRIAR
jgi:glycosyltransferase involved in cell wall biosynthesis